MHAKPDLRVFLEWMIAGSGSVITDVITLEFMNGIIKKTKDSYEAAKSIVVSVGPYLLAQSEKTSDAYARHKIKMANVDATKLLMIEEAKSIAKARDTLREKYIEATPEERIRIRRDLHDIECDIRQMQIATTAIEYLPEFSPHTNEPTNDSASAEDPEIEPVPDHWMDRFNSYARKSNEPWRSELLSRALALQATNPDAVTLRALWTIGTLEKSKFDAFSAILDISSSIHDSIFIPGTRVFSLKIPKCDLGVNVSLGSIAFELGDTGLLADTDSQLTIPKDGLASIRYRNTGYHIKNKTGPIKITGMMPSETGASIARFYQTRDNPFGLELLNKWIGTLKGENYEKQGPLTIAG